ncbi:hypothetical protein HA402_003048 [Bradysia odoriphaga]|nr:hypothetical protein HA402_003048 [Bradysia odoriphaga]
MRTELIFILCILSVCKSSVANHCDVFVSDGVYPDCVCRDPNEEYDLAMNFCYSCPEYSSGRHPNCSCEDPFVYVSKYIKCVKCPEGSTGTYPHCTCNYGYFSEAFIRCIQCPTDATGSYPECECHDANLRFSAFINQCYRECPSNSSGIQPNCHCDGEYFYDANEGACKSNIGRMCPADSTGIGPNCVCIGEDQIFSSSTWSCYRKIYGVTPIPKRPESMTCPEKKKKWPQCDVLIDDCVLRSCIG